MALSDARLKIVNQMILAVIFAVGFLAFLFVLLLVPQKDLNQTYVTIVSNLLSILGTVIVMQQTHFFKAADPSPSSSTGVPPNVGTQINANSVVHAPAATTVAAPGGAGSSGTVGVSAAQP